VVVFSGRREPMPLLGAAAVGKEWLVVSVGVGRLRGGRGGVFGTSKGGIVV
jgi:hypothetical protein